ncbi:hypothetical protein SODG_006897 [Sodalis praecaptivus]
MASRLPSERAAFRFDAVARGIISLDLILAQLEGREGQFHAVLAIAFQDQRVDLMAQRHPVPHFGGVHTQLK